MRDIARTRIVEMQRDAADEYAGAVSATATWLRIQRQEDAARTYRLARRLFLNKYRDMSAAPVRNPSPSSGGSG